MAFRTLLQSLLTISFILAMLPQVAMAQEEEEAPLRLVYLNTAGSDGRDSFRSIEAILDDSDRIDLFRPRDFWRAAEDFGLDQDSFRQSSEREANIDSFSELMRRTNLEGILIHDVFGGGNTMQVVVLGPQGWQLADIRHSISRGRIDQDGSVEVLRQVFTTLVPEVRGFRRELEEEKRIAQEAQEQAEQEQEEEEETSEDEYQAMREQAWAEHRAKYGNLTPHLSARVGPLLGFRSLQFFESQGGFAINHRTPLFGVGLQVDSLITTIERDTAAIEASGFVGFAPFTTFFGETPLSGQYIRAGADLRYINARSPYFRLRVIAGVETLNITLDPNEQYTGHGYLMGRGGLGIHYSFGSLLTMQVDALILPIVIASNSGGAYGEAEGWLGYGAEVGLSLDLFEPLLVNVDYRFQQLNVEFPHAPMLQSTALSQDMIHQTMISVGYRF